MLSRRPPLVRSSHDLAGFTSDGIHTSAARTPPEINLIPFIDVLLVVLIFLMISTTFTKFQELAITLPSAEGTGASSTPAEISVAVNQEGRYAVDGVLVDSRSLVEKLTKLSSQWKTNDNIKEGRLIISADARAPHQTVMRVLEAAREAGIANVSFATQSKSAPAKTKGQR